MHPWGPFCAPVRGSVWKPISTVEEVLKHEQNGLLVDFFSTEQIVCESKDSSQAPRDAARQTIIEKCDFETVCLPQHSHLFEAQEF